VIQILIQFSAAQKMSTYIVMLMETTTAML